MVLVPPKCLATTTEEATEAGEVPRAALATEVEGMVATATLAGAREEATKVARGEAMEEEEEEVPTEERVVATKEAPGARGGVGGSGRSPVQSFCCHKCAFLSCVPLLLLALCFCRLRPLVPVQLCNILCP